MIWEGHISRPMSSQEFVPGFNCTLKYRSSLDDNLVDSASLRLNHTILTRSLGLQRSFPSDSYTGRTL